MAAPNDCNLASRNTFKCWYHGDPQDRRLHVTLPRTGTTTALEALANAAAFRYLCGSSNNTHPLDESVLLSEAPESGNTPKSPTHTKVGVSARQILRKFRFELVAMGIGRMTSSSAEAPLSPWEPSPIPSFDHPWMQELFQQRARSVESLLHALDRARCWSPTQLLHLCSNVEGCPTNIVDRLQLLFGEDLRADVIVPTEAAIGSVSGRIDTPESAFNTNLHYTVVVTANAVLRLVGMAGDETEQGAFQALASIEDSDQMAAAIIVRAVLRHSSGRILALFNCGSGRGPKGVPSDAFTCSQPDWALVSKTDQEVTVIGTVEHKPWANRRDLADFCKTRQSPLGPLKSCSTVSTDDTAAEPAGDTRPSKRPRLYRKAAPAAGTQEERPTTPEAERRQPLIADNSAAPPNFGYVDSALWQKLALQLSSQMLFHNVRNGLLWADWGRALLPVQLTPASNAFSAAVDTLSDDSRPYALSCAAVARSDPSNPSSPEESNSRAEAEDPVSMLRFTDQPNVIMGLVKWAIYAEADQRARGRLIPPGEPTPLSLQLSGVEQARQSSGASNRGSNNYASGFTHRGPSNRNLSLGNQEGQTEDASDNAQENSEQACTSGERLAASGSEGSTGQSGSLQASVPSSSTRMAADSCEPVISSVPADGAYAPDNVRPGRQWGQVAMVPFASGRYADVHRGKIKFPGEPVQDCVYKFNCPPGLREKIRDESPDVDDDYDGGAVGRFERELEVLEALESLQGTVVPRLLGTSRVLSMRMPEYPSSLVLEDVGKRIDEPDAWPPGMSNEEKACLVEDAYDRLHDAGWIHCDVAPRNILVSYHHPEGSTEAALRVCLVDFARARRTNEFFWDNAELETVLDDLFGADEET